MISCINIILTPYVMNKNTADEWERLSIVYYKWVISDSMGYEI